MTAVGRVVELWRYPVKSMAGEQIARTTLGACGIPGDRGWALRDEAAGEIRGAKKMPVLMRCRARYDEEPDGERVPPASMTLPDGSTLRTTDPDVNARLSALVDRTVTLWALQPAEARDHYRRGLPDNPDMEAELRQVFGRLPDEPLPDLSVIPQELFEFTSPLGTYFDAFPLHLLTDASLDALRRKTPSADFDPRRFRANFLIETTNGSEGLLETSWTGRPLRIGNVAIKVEMPTARCVMTTLPQGDLAKQPAVLRTIVREGDQCLGVYATVTEPGQVAVGDPVELTDE